MTQGFLNAVSPYKGLIIWWYFFFPFLGYPCTPTEMYTLVSHEHLRTVGDLTYAPHKMQWISESWYNADYISDKYFFFSGQLFLKCFMWWCINPPCILRAYKVHGLPLTRDAVPSLSHSALSPSQPAPDCALPSLEERATAHPALPGSSKAYIFSVNFLTNLEYKFLGSA